MRWSMLPVSVVIHAAALMLFLLGPLAADLDLPAPWPQGVRGYVIAAAAPAPPVDRSRTAPRPSSAAPTRAADSIEIDAPDSGPATVAAGGLPSGGPATSGIPDDFGVGGVSTPPPPPPPSAVERPTLLRVGGTIREPRKVVHVPAVYPEFARQARVGGRVIVEATIDELGYVTDARVLQSQPLLDAAALVALKQWRYTPTLLNGVPVKVLMTITFNFSLGDNLP